MQEIRDLNNKDIIRNYIAMPDKKQFNTVHISNVTGVPIKTVQNEIRRLEKRGLVTRIGFVGKHLWYRQNHIFSGEQEQREDNVVIGGYLLTAQEGEFVRLSRQMSKNDVMDAMKLTRGKADVLIQSIRKKGVCVRFFARAAEPRDAKRILDLMIEECWYTNRQILHLAELKYPCSKVNDMVKCGLLEQRKTAERKIFYKKVTNGKS